nr:MAG TPA: hypothetical protein [Caudoviricetes sp.]
MNLASMATTLNKVGNAALRTLEHHAPKILLGVSIVCGVGATVTACKATLKLPETMKEINEQVDAAKNIVVDEDDKPAHADAEKEKNHEVAKAYISGGVKLAKLYGPSIGLTASSIVCALAGSRVMNKRYAGALAAINSTEKMFSEYRKRVVEELGVDKDTQFANGIREVVTEEPILDKNGNPKTDKNGEVKTTKKTELEYNPDVNKYSRMFDEVSTNEWAPNADYNKTRLMSCQNYFNEMLHVYRYVFLNDVYKYLGYPITAYGQDVGWIIDEDTPDPTIDLGLYDFNANGSRRIDDLDEHTNAILLTFKNVRYIKDKVYRAQRMF